MTIRTQFVVIFSILLVLLSAIIFIMERVADNHDTLAKQEHIRFESHKLANQIRHSSDDLTRMARTYVATGDKKYKAYFQEILAIRNGTAPRPLNYNQVYWDFVIGNGVRPEGFGEPISLLSMLKELGLSSQEIAKLEEATKFSDDLASLENKAFDALQEEVDGVAGTKAAEKEFARDILHGEQYDKAKSKIMRPILEFMILLDARIRKKIENARIDMNYYNNLLYVMIVMTVLFSVFAYFYIRWRIINPVLSLAMISNRIEKGELGARATRKSSDEVGKLFDAFNSMTEKNRVAIANLKLENLERRKVEKELEIARANAEEANLAKSKFLAAMSHDLRTPLNAITGFSDMMRLKIYGPLGNTHYEEYADAINYSALLLVSQINDILDLAKVESGKYKLTEKLLEIAGVVRSSFLQVEVSAKSSGHTMTALVAPDAPGLLGDEKIMIQILNNLLSNAIKFTPFGGNITVISSVDDENCTVISVMDTGIGMSEDDIVKVLVPFEQADGTLTRNHIGTGLGLHLCVNFMELFGGTLKLESVVNEGTTVTLRFPPERTLNS